MSEEGLRFRQLPSGQYELQFVGEPEEQRLGPYNITQLIEHSSLIRHLHQSNAEAFSIPLKRLEEISGSPLVSEVLRPADVARFLFLCKHPSSLFEWTRTNDTTKPQLSTLHAINYSGELDTLRSQFVKWQLSKNEAAAKAMDDKYQELKACGIKQGRNAIGILPSTLLQCSLHEGLRAISHLRDAFAESNGTVGAETSSPQPTRRVRMSVVQVPRLALLAQCFVAKSVYKQCVKCIATRHHQLVSHPRGQEQLKFITPRALKDVLTIISIARTRLSTEDRRREAANLSAAVEALSPGASITTPARRTPRAGASTTHTVSSPSTLETKHSSERSASLTSTPNSQVSRGRLAQALDFSKEEISAIAEGVASSTTSSSSQRSAQSPFESPISVRCDAGLVHSSRTDGSHSTVHGASVEPEVAGPTTPSFSRTARTSYTTSALTLHTGNSSNSSSTLSPKRHGVLMQRSPDLSCQRREVERGVIMTNKQHDSFLDNVPNPYSEEDGSQEAMGISEADVSSIAGKDSDGADDNFFEASMEEQQMINQIMHGYSYSRAPANVSSTEAQPYWPTINRRCMPLPPITSTVWVCIQPADVAIGMPYGPPQPWLPSVGEGAKEANGEGQQPTNPHRPEASSSLLSEVSRSDASSGSSCGDSVESTPGWKRAARRARLLKQQQKEEEERKAHEEEKRKQELAKVEEKAARIRRQLAAKQQQKQQREESVDSYGSENSEETADEDFSELQLAQNKGPALSAYYLRQKAAQERAKRQAEEEQRKRAEQERRRRAEIARYAVQAKAGKRAALAAKKLREEKEKEEEEARRKEELKWKKRDQRLEEFRRRKAVEQEMKRLNAQEDGVGASATSPQHGDSIGQAYQPSTPERTATMNAALATPSPPPPIPHAVRQQAQALHPSSVHETPKHRELPGTAAHFWKKNASPKIFATQ